jgi:hypothetical protein
LESGRSRAESVFRGGPKTAAIVGYGQQFEQ